MTIFLQADDCGMIHACILAFFLSKLNNTTNYMKLVKQKSISSLFAAGLLAFGTNSASAVVLTFEGVGNLVQVGNYYNGGAGGNLGISFATGALAIVDSDAGGTGNFGGEPSESTILFFTDGNAATMNVAGGFTTGFSFFYSAISQGGFVNVYDGLNATGNILATLTLPTTPNNGAPDPTGVFSPFVPVGVGFSGTAMSVDFGGTANQIGFDDVTIGNQTPGGPASVPDGGSTIAMLGLALTAAAGIQRKFGI